MIATRHLALLSVACAPAPASIDTPNPTPREATYRATNLATAIDRLHVSREDDDGCAWFTLAHDGSSSSFPDLTLPERWSLHAPGWEPVEGCGDHYSTIDHGEPAIDAAGTADVLVDDDSFFRSVDLDVTLTFADGRRIHFVGVVPVE